MNILNAYPKKLLKKFCFPSITVFPATQHFTNTSLNCCDKSGTWEKFSNCLFTTNTPDISTKYKIISVTITTFLNTKSVWLQTYSSVQYKNLNTEPSIFQSCGFLQFCTCLIFHGFKIILNEKTYNVILLVVKWLNISMNLETYKSIKES